AWPRVGWRSGARCRCQWRRSPGRWAASVRGWSGVVRILASRAGSEESSRVVLVGLIGDGLLEVRDAGRDEQAAHLDAAGAVGQVARRLGVQLAALHA